MVSVDIDADLARQAREHLAAAGYPDVTVAAADGVGGYPPGAPYDRIIATVGVSDLAPAWLDQAGPGAKIVVPLGIRGLQVAVAFERSGSGGCWVSRSVIPCGFMRIRGALAGPERTVVLQPGLSVMLPDGLTLADGHEADGAALAAFLDGPASELAAGAAAGLRQLWGLGLWLGTHDRRSCAVTEERPADGTPGLTRPGTVPLARDREHARDRGFRRPRDTPAGAAGPRGRRLGRPGRPAGSRVRPARRGARRRPGRARPGLGSGRAARRGAAARERLPAVRAAPGLARTAPPRGHCSLSGPAPASRSTT